MRLALCALAGLAVTAGCANSNQRLQAAAHTAQLPIGDKTCYGPRTTGTPKCELISYSVLTAFGPNPDDPNMPLCFAYFNYNDLNIKLNATALGTTLSWTPPANGRWIGDGIEFRQLPGGPPVADLIQSQAPGTVVLRAVALGKLAHQPRIELVSNNQKCTPVDPGFLVDTQ